MKAALPAVLATLSTRATFAAALLLGACATTAPPEATLQPNANLVVQGIPPIPMSLVKQVEPYTEFRGHRFVDWHPTRREMLVSHRKAGGSTAQLFRVTAPLAEPEQLTDFPDPVNSGSYEPREGRYVVFEKGSGGNEATQLFRLDLETRQSTLLTDADQRHDFVGWLHAGGRVIASSVPLDRTAQGGTRARIDTTLWLIDPLAPQARRQLAVLPGSGWFGGSVSPDDKTVAMVRYLSAGESQVWLIDLQSGSTRQLLPRAGDPPASYYASDFKADGSGLFVTTTHAGEFLELALARLDDGLLTRISSGIPWDVEGVDASADGRLVALRANVDGRSELRLFDGATLQERPRPQVPAGSVEHLHFDRRSGALALAIDGAQGPSQLSALDPASGKVEQWTRAHAPPGIDTRGFADQQIVRWTSFDGRSISGLLSAPPARFGGKRPVLIDIHGGPEAQATVGFLGRFNYLVNELGITVIEPNVRGSSGYGKSFLALDNGRLREDSVKDIGALLDWIAAQPKLDVSRVLVSGGSYGGYMSLAVAARYADRIAGAIDVVGISHFVTFLENTESYRRDLRRVEYGDERDPAMRTFLDGISPLTNAGRITKPLLVVQGRNDPRVPYTEAEQIVAKARANGTTVWYLRAENEGHGFVRKENADFYFYTTLRFMQATLLKP